MWGIIKSEQSWVQVSESTTTHKKIRPVGCVTLAVQLPPAGRHGAGPQDLNTPQSPGSAELFPRYIFPVVLLQGHGSAPL